MKTLVISKPRYDYILPLAEFPQDGDKFFIDKSIKTLSNVGPLVAITLANYGIDTSFTGVIGEDDLGRQIKTIFENNKVDTSLIETSFEEHTSINYSIYNMKTNKFTRVIENSIKKGLMKYKYEFIPDAIIMDNEDYNANMAAINNYPDANLIYIGEKFTKDASVYCNKCNYVIANLSFASEATGVLNDLNKPKTIVNLFQKYIDLYKSKLIIKLDNFDLLYCIDDEVRLIKNENKNLTNKEYIYYSVLIYFLINTNNIEESIKYTNKAMLNSKSELNMIDNIPLFNEVNTLLEELKNKINTNIENNNKKVENINTNTINNQMESNTNNIEQTNISTSNNQQNPNNINQVETNLTNNQNTNVISNNTNNNVEVLDNIEIPNINNNIENKGK